nr:hypothetical protein [uncultured Cardiobacterium sp.]
MDVMMNHEKTFGFIWEINSFSSEHYFGKIQILIGEELYPKFCPKDHYSISIVFDNLKWSFKEPCYPGGSNGKDFGERKFSAKKYNKLKINNILSIETSEMGMNVGNNHDYSLDSLLLEMGYSGTQERLFYSFDHGNSYREIRFPKGTVESIIFKLPSNIQLKDMVDRIL